MTYIDIVKIVVHVNYIFWFHFYRLLAITFLFYDSTLMLYMKEWLKQPFSSNREVEKKCSQPFYFFRVESFQLSFQLYYDREIDFFCWPEGTFITNISVKCTCT